MNASVAITAVPVCHVIKGEVVTGIDQMFGPAEARFATPKLDLDALVWSRQEPGPAFELPVSEIMMSWSRRGDI